MLLSNSRASFVFLSILLVLCCIIVSAADHGRFPQSLCDALQGKTADLSSIADKLEDHELPAALAVIDLLEFRTLHQETALTIEQIGHFESQIKSRLENSSVVSFSKTETCRKKIEAKEIEIAGQKLFIPEYYIANAGLAITGVIPTGEAGTVFPDIQINFVSQSRMKEYCLNIDGKAISSGKTSLFEVNGEQRLVFRPDLNSDNILSIGTHTAEITISNEKGETACRKWSFTVGLQDVATPPLPEGVVIERELPVDLRRILPAGDTDGNLSVIVYQDKTGRRFTEYKFVFSSGLTMKSRNLAFIAKRLRQDTNSRAELVILPQISHAFTGNAINFSCKWVGSGKVVAENWRIYSGNAFYNSPSIIIQGNTSVQCDITVEFVIAGSENTYQTNFSIIRHIRELAISADIFTSRHFSISAAKPCEFDLVGRIILDLLYKELFEGAEFNFTDNQEKIETDDNSAVLRVDRLRWKIIDSEGMQKINNPMATHTRIIFADYGFAEVVFDVELTYREAGVTLRSSFKPSASALFAFYPVEGRAELVKTHKGQLTGTRRLVSLKKIDFKIKNQQRVIENESDCKLKIPVLLCRSSLWPASSPIEITDVYPDIKTKVDIYNGSLEKKNLLSFYTPSLFEATEIPLWLHCRFLQVSGHDEKPSPRYDSSFVEELPAISVYEGEEILDASISPSEEQTIPEGMQVTFTTELSPLAGFGEGSLSESSNDEGVIDLLDGYKISRFSGIEWLEDPMWENEEDDEDWKSRAIPTKDFSHIFKPVKGVGSYTMRCGFWFQLEESETSDTSWVFPENGTPVNAIPGLRILSPVDGLIYPQSVPVKVTTTMDDKTELWQKIKWTLNDNEFKPEVEKPPFVIRLDRPGKWKLAAELKTKNPITDEEMILTDVAEFEVRPLEIFLDPTRRMVDFSSQNELPLKLGVKSGNSVAAKPGEPFTWGDSSQKAVVEPIEWSLFEVPEDCATADFDPQNFLSTLGFADTGAATVLATVTVRLLSAESLFRKKHKGFKDIFEEQVFTFPAVRADVWAVMPPTWFNTTGKTARRAIQNTNRLFSLISGEINFFGREYSWNSSSDFADKIQIPAAIPNISPLTSVGVKFAWSGPDEQSSETPEFKPYFKNIGSQEVVMGSAIEFDSGDSINFENDKTDVKVEPLSKVIYVKVMANPSSVGKNQPSQVSLSFGEINGAMESQTQLDIWNGEYNLKLTKVDWSCSGGVLTPTGDNSANAKFSSSDVGQFKIAGTPNFSVKPLDCDEVDMALNPGETSVKVLGSLIGIKVDNTLSDHLKKIRYATDPENDIYDKSNNHIWSRTETRPLVVACNSTITLIPEFGGRKRLAVRDGVTFQWFDSDGLLSLSGNTDLGEKIEFPTPTVIDKYTLKLGFDVVGETIEIPETYTVKKISEKSTSVTGTANIVYYVKCIKDSVEALKGKNFETEDAKLINDFYAWWWKLYPSKNELKYGLGGGANTHDVINNNGGMCHGLGNYFFKCLEVQGVDGLHRIGFLLNNIRMPLARIPGTDIDHFPYFHEFWGAIFVDNLGLNNKDPVFWVPNNESESITPYLRESLKVYNGSQKIPPADLKNVLVDIQNNVMIKEHSEGFCFRAPDGHALVFFEDKSSGRIHLLDPSFYHKRTMIELSDLPPIGNFLIKDIDHDPDPKFKDFLEYLSFFSYFRGNTAFKSPEFMFGMAIFDFRIDQMNFLRANFEYYNSSEERFK